MTDLEFTSPQLATRYHLPVTVVERVLTTDDQAKWHGLLTWLANLGEGQILYTPYSPDIKNDAIQALPKTFPAQLFP